MTKKSLLTEELKRMPEDVGKEIELSFAIADYIAAVLKRRNMTQKQFAEKVGKTENEVSRWLGGTHNFTLRTIAKISVALGEDIISVGQ